MEQTSSDRTDRSQGVNRRSFLRLLAIFAAAVAAVHCLIVAAVLVANIFWMREIEPTESLVLQELREAIRNHPDDNVLRESFRRMDRELRRAFYRAHTFSRFGAWTLLGGVAVLLASLHALRALTVRPAAPGDGECRSADVLRRSLGMGGLLLALMVLGTIYFSGRFVSERSEGPGSTVDVEASGRGEGLTGDIPSPGAVERDVSAYPSREELFRNWPCFRGALGDGVVRCGDVPKDWDALEDRGILWKNELPRPGFSSPVVWDGKVFVSVADEEAREVFCYDGETGDMLWRCEVSGIPGSPEEMPDVTEDTGLAASTPAVDGRHVFALFATGDLVCIDFAGQLAWAKNLGVPDNYYGHSSSLIMHNGRLLIQYDHFKGSRLIALDSETGETAWETERDNEISWSSPALVETPDRMEVILAGSPKLTAYDAVTGELVWSAECLGGEVAPSPAYADGMVFAANDYAFLSAVHTGEKGKKPGTVAWQTDDDLPDVASPLATGELVLTASSLGVVTCRGAKDGALKWKKEFPEAFYASPVLVGDLVYLTDVAGITVIFRASGTFEKVAECDIGEGVVSTGAFVEGRIYLRGRQSLIAVGGSD